jgi:hypothetical protein
MRLTKPMKTTNLRSSARIGKVQEGEETSYLFHELMAGESGFFVKCYHDT